VTLYYPRRRIPLERRPLFGPTHFFVRDLRIGSYKKQSRCNPSFFVVLPKEHSETLGIPPHVAIQPCYLGNAPQGLSGYGWRVVSTRANAVALDACGFGGPAPEVARERLRMFCFCVCCCFLFHLLVHVLCFIVAFVRKPTHVGLLSIAYPSRVAVARSHIAHLLDDPTSIVGKGDVIVPEIKIYHRLDTNGDHACFVVQFPVFHTRLLTDRHTYGMPICVIPIYHNDGSVGWQISTKEALDIGMYVHAKDRLAIHTATQHLKSIGMS